jgi:superfamily II DNA or RNA helicase
MISSLFTIDPWPHQLKGVSDTVAALGDVESVCMTSPTGSGKTQMEIALVQWGVKQGWNVALFTNRILLTEQTRRVFHREGILAGVVSASMPQYEYEDAECQIATIQTVLSRQKNSDYRLTADLVLVDEVHQVSTGESASLLNQYKKQGAKVVGVTATPLGVSNVCDKLVVAAGTRDLQDEGKLCFAKWFAPSELDTRKLVKGKVDLSLSENEARRTWGPLKGDDAVRTRIVGNILQHYRQLHPRQIHTLAFAPGVKESMWAARFCWTNGIRALHIDGSDFWCDGKLYDRKKNEKEFKDFMQEWRDGDIPIIWNRFVMREGIDEPQIECLMFATPIGSYRSFLQMAGRGLRVSDETPHEVTVLDFGGAWWRHGSVNVNVDWHDVFDCADPDVISKNRIAKLRETGESVGRACPKCGMVHKAKGRMLVCQYCGHEMFRGKPSRPIIQADGTLTEVNGEPVKQWKIKEAATNEKIWNGLYWNAMKHKGGEITFNQLYSQFGYKTAVEQGSRQKPAFWNMYYPPKTLPLMPKRRNDWHLPISEVAKDRLI